MVGMLQGSVMLVGSADQLLLCNIASITASAADSVAL
jgi:hypothetical protein